MIFLKGILYLILSICFFWGVAIYAGSSIIKSASRIAFGDDVKLSNVVVEADLTISVGVLDFDLKSKAESVPIFGKLRAIKMDWSLFSSNPHVKITVGPSHLNGFFEFEAAKISLMPIKITSVKDLITRVEINKILFGDEVFLHELLANGVLDGEKIIFSDVNFDLFDLETEKYPKLAMHHLTGTIDRYQLSSHFSDQKNTILMSSNEVTFGPKDEGLSSLLSEIENQYGRINSVTKIGELKGYEDQLFIKDINITHIGNVDTISTSGTIGLSLNNIEYGPYNLNIDDMLVEAEVGYEGFQMDVAGELVELGLNLDGYYLGELGSSDFDVDVISLFSDNPSKVTLHGQLISHTHPILKSNLAAEAHLSEKGNFLVCLSSLCDLESLSLRYEFDIGGSALKGESKCEQAACNLSSYSHYLSTNDTGKFVENLLSTEIVNPLMVALLHSSLKQGTQKGNGHLRHY